MRVKLIVTIDYDICEVGDRNEAFSIAEDQLSYTANHIANNGLLSGDTELMVDEWKAEVTLQHGD